ncbi:MFS transporter [Herbiconiux sp. 11R-BC]|uniref:MFS transporter n=1 Tax=Herbiconiux sp. 11R-BC TaxID=3111637 RepID=UPI003BFF3409
MNTNTPIRRRPSAWRTATIAGMASYIDSAAIVTFGTVIVIYQAVLGLTPLEVGVASGALTLSVAAGALVGGRLGDRFGRRPVFTVTMILIIIGIAILFLAPSFPVIITGAIFLGVGSGADLPVSLSTISEAASDANRGKFLGFSNMLWAVGVLVSTVIAIFVGDLGRTGGQILFAHIGIVALVVLLARLTVPESETWLEARRERARGIHTIRADRSGALRLVRTPYAKPFLGLIAFYALANLAANTVGQFGAYLLVNTGGVSVSTAGVLTLVIAPLNFLSYFWFMRIADGRHRFRYFTAGALLWVVGLAVPAVFGLSLVTYLIAAAFAALGMGFAFETIMKVWSQESFPTLLRTTAQGTIISTARIVAALMATVTPALAAAGPNALYSVLAVLVAIGMVIAWLTFRTRDGHNEFDVEAADNPTAATHVV